MQRHWTVIGAPSSAGAHAPGAEKAPGAVRAAGLVEALRRGGTAVDDAGDVPGFRWRPDPARPRAQNAAAVARVAGDVAAAVHAAASGGRVPLVLGGDRTVSVGLVAGLTRWCGHAPALIYLSGSPGLLTPQTGLTGNLDGMVLAHLLGVAGHLPELAGLAAQVPLLTPERVVLYGADIPYGHHERVMIDRLGLHYFPARDIVGPLMAGHARATAEAAAPAFAVHFGVDALAFDEAPLADVPEPVGISLADAAASVATFAASPHFTGLSLTAINPDHLPDNDLLPRFVELLATALTGTQRH